MAAVDEADTWSMEELLELAAAALAVGYRGTPTARARDLPDVRSARWYVTRGLLDRPLSRGRFARYGRRHLLQLVAIKRRQAEGRSLAEIQAELTGATDRSLEAIARLAPNGEPPPADGAALIPADRRSRFWTEPAAEPEAPAAAGRSDGSALVHALRLAPGVTLLVDANLGPLDPDAVRRAATALLDLIDPTANRPEGENDR
jgi:hypothetical protein